MKPRPPSARRKRRDESGEVGHAGSAGARNLIKSRGTSGSAISPHYSREMFAIPTNDPIEIPQSIGMKTLDAVGKSMKSSREMMRQKKIQMRRAHAAAATAQERARVVQQYRAAAAQCSFAGEDTPIGAIVVH